MQWLKTIGQYNPVTSETTDRFANLSTPEQRKEAIHNLANVFGLDDFIEKERQSLTAE